MRLLNMLSDFYGLVSGPAELPPENQPHMIYIPGGNAYAVLIFAAALILKIA